MMERKLLTLAGHIKAMECLTQSQSSVLSVETEKGAAFNH